MRRLLILSAFTLLALPAMAIAEPLLIKGTKSAVWTNPTGGPSTGSGTDWLRFGEYDAGSLGWSGGHRFSTFENTPFSLGIAWLTNGSSSPPPTHMNFAVTLNFTHPEVDGPATFAFDASLLSTNQNGGGDLKFSLVPGQTPSWTSSGGKRYSLEMLGLSNNWEWDNKTFPELTAVADCDNNQSYAWIWAKIHVDEPTPPPQVPEPSALVLAGVGIGLLVAVHWRRRVVIA